ncbi:PAS domain-containing protein [Halarsenatibacter silvermanii]|uniref:PAS domain-containing protein n=1 Tax=Halarsenatibacter silvermanii TaxID=321763 RepID=A0A1G9TJ97_9FIRM|nr:PAS domain-containing protein [Halarsenatibacter silvermanii]SDM47235.1 PAS domain-containing protein [Halarsenatibacter silvermanii]
MKNFENIVLNNLGEIIIYMSPDFRIEWCNQKALEYFGSSMDELKGKYCYEKWGLNDYCDTCPVQQVKNNREIASSVIEKPDGSYWKMKGIPDITEENE